MRVFSLVTVALTALVALAAASPAPTAPTKIVRATLDIGDVMTRGGGGMARLRALKPNTPVRLGKTALPAYVFMEILASRAQTAAPTGRVNLRSGQTLTVTTDTAKASHQGSPPPYFKTGTERVPVQKPQLEVLYDNVKVPPQQLLGPNPWSPPYCQATLCAKFADGHLIPHEVTEKDYTSSQQAQSFGAFLSKKPDGSYDTAKDGNCYLVTGLAFVSEVACPGTVIQVPSEYCHELCAPQHFQILIRNSWFFDHYEWTGCSDFKIIPTTGKDDGAAKTLDLEIKYPDPSKYSTSTEPVSCSVNVFITGPAGSQWRV